MGGGGGGSQRWKQGVEREREKGKEMGKFLGRRSANSRGYVGILAAKAPRVFASAIFWARLGLCSVRVGFRGLLVLAQSVFSPCHFTFYFVLEVFFF